MNLRQPENMFLSGSNQGLPKGAGCTGNMKGGQKVQFVHDPNIPMGPRGGLMAHVAKPNCGVNNPSNLGASSQHGGTIRQGNASYGFDGVSVLDGVPPGAFSYAPITNKPQMGCLKGGSNVRKTICREIGKIKEFSDVSHFWHNICPGAVAIYKKYLTKKEKSKYFLKFLKEYTRAFCQEVYALESKSHKIVKEHLSKFKTHMRRAKQFLYKMTPKALRMHDKVYDMHFARISEHLKYTKPSKSTRKQVKKKVGSRKLSRGGSKKKSSRGGNTNKNKKSSIGRNKTRKNMGGGSAYHQFNSNVPYTPTYGINNSSFENGGTLSSPIPVKVSNNCTDVYNHYTKTNYESPMR
tara:strand:- start:1094 stop:2146 length:1053 start_codon:yes stop_codon:yes gene_type:complete